MEPLGLKYLAETKRVQNRPEAKKRDKGRSIRGDKSNNDEISFRPGHDWSREKCLLSFHPDYINNFAGEASNAEPARECNSGSQMNLFSFTFFSSLPLWNLEVIEHGCTSQAQRPTEQGLRETRPPVDGDAGEKSPV